MPNRLSHLTRRYATILRKFSANKDEASLEKAYALGRAAIAGEFGILDMARLHQQALSNLLRPALDANKSTPIVRAAETFFLESLSPFEATHRGFRETASDLQRVVTTLEKKNEELSVINRTLSDEIDVRKRTERALRDSEEHYRELFNNARAMEERLRKLSNQVLHVQEEERKRISRELHDEAGQALTAISVILASVDDGAGGSVELNRKKVAEAQRLLQRTQETLHDFARELRPTMLDELGLLPALRSYLKAFAERNKVEVHFKSTPEVEQLGGTQKTVLFRVAQESLTNIAKHARASRVDCRIQKTRNRVCMTIADNGRSFSAESRKTGEKSQRLGLLGMQERVRLVNGRFTILPRLGKGTTVHVAIPFATAAATPMPVFSQRNDTHRRRKLIEKKPQNRKTKNGS